MRKINVLVSGVGGDVGQGVVKALERSTLDLDIFMTCVFEDSSWLHQSDRTFIVPFSASEEYIPYLIRLIKAKKIDIFFPSVDSEIVKIAQNREVIESSTGCKVFVGETADVDLCDDKFKTFEFLKREGFAYPDSTLLLREDVEQFLVQHSFPLVVKKRFDNGAKNVRIAYRKEELDDFIDNRGFMLQEWLNPAEGEYTTGVYIGTDYEIKGMCTLRRELKCGSTYKAKRIIDKALEKPLGEMARKLGPGYWNIQAMLRGKTLVPFEFNGRFSGTTGIISRVFNAPEMAIREYVLKERLEYTDTSEAFTVMRFFEEIYTDERQLDALKQRSEKI